MNSVHNTPQLALVSALNNEVQLKKIKAV